MSMPKVKHKCKRLALHSCHCHANSVLFTFTQRDGGCVSTAAAATDVDIVNTAKLHIFLRINLSEKNGVY